MARPQGQLGSRQDGGAGKERCRYKTEATFGTWRSSGGAYQEVTHSMGERYCLTGQVLTLPATLREQPRFASNIAAHDAIGDGRKRGLRAGGHDWACVKA